MDQAEHAQEGTSGRDASADLGALLARNEQERHALIDAAIFDAIRQREEGGAGTSLSTDVARALEARGARLLFHEVMDGILRLVRRGVVRARSTGTFSLPEPVVPAGAPPTIGDRPRPSHPHVYPGVAAVQAGGRFFPSDCANGCGCWMGDARSGGPDGLDAFGECPGAPSAEVAA